jgi:hypothetical protein
MAEGDVPGQELIGVTRCRNVIGVFICELASLKPFDVPMDLSDDAGGYNAAAADSNGASLMATLERVPYAENRAPAPADLIVRGGSAAGSSSVEENFSPTAASAAAAAIPAHSAAGSASATPPVTRQQPNTNFFDAHAAGGGGVQIAVPTKPRPQPQPAAAPAQPYVAPQAAAPAANAGPSGVAAAAPSSRHQRDGSNGLTAAASASASSIAIDPRQLPPSKFVTPAAATAAPAASSSAAIAASSSDSAASSAAATEAAAAALAAARRKVESDHPQVLQILQDRAARLRELATLWQSSGGSLGGAKRCVESLASRPDNAVTHDFLMFVEPVLIVRGNSGAGVNLTLDVARDLLPLLIKLLAQQPRYQNYIELALRYVRMLLVQFTPVIQSQCPPPEQQPHAAMLYFSVIIGSLCLLFLVCLLLDSRFPCVRVVWRRCRRRGRDTRRALGARARLFRALQNRLRSPHRSGGQEEQRRGGTGEGHQSASGKTALLESLTPADAQQLGQRTCFFPSFFFFFSLFHCSTRDRLFSLFREHFLSLLNSQFSRASAELLLLAAAKRMTQDIAT